MKRLSKILLLALFSFFLLGAKKGEYSSYIRQVDQLLYRVVALDQNGPTIESRGRSFENVWQKPDATVSDEHITIKWEDTVLPLDPKTPTVGFAFTYKSHADDTGVDAEPFCFGKNAKIVSHDVPLAYRPYLDPELELGIYARKKNLEESASNIQIGVVVSNDLSRRDIQVRESDTDNLAPGFTKSKSFSGSNRIGKILVITNASHWKAFQAKLFVNGKLRQQIDNRNHLLGLKRGLEMAFRCAPKANSVLAMMGTPEGTVFKGVSFWEKVKAFLFGGFSMAGAREYIVEHIMDQKSYLQLDDTMEFQLFDYPRESTKVSSNALGHNLENR